MGRRPVASDPDVAPGGADVADRDHGDAQIELEFRWAKAAIARERLGGRGGVLRADGETRAVAAEDERKRAAPKRIGDRGDHARRRSC